MDINMGKFSGLLEVPHFCLQAELFLKAPSQDQCKVTAVKRWSHTKMYDSLYTCAYVHWTRLCIVSSVDRFSQAEVWLVLYGCALDQTTVSSVDRWSHMEVHTYVCECMYVHIYIHTYIALSGNHISGLWWLYIRTYVRM